MSRKSALDDLFARYTAAFRSSLKSLVKLEEQWKVNDKAFFNEKSTRWINLSLARDDAPSETPRGTYRESSRGNPRESTGNTLRDSPHEPSRENAREIPRETPPGKVHLSANTASSRGSRVGSRASNVSSTRLLAAQLKVRLLQEEQKIKTTEQELEKE